VLKPAAVKREVWTRDQGRCAVIGSAGRCSETGFLEYHHVVPFAMGGMTDAANLELRCRAHNAYEATVWFGEEAGHGARASARRPANSVRTALTGDGG
jgi:5-methylcytosine-specific restriction endonuclease McrA